MKSVTLPTAIPTKAYLTFQVLYADGNQTVTKLVEESSLYSSRGSKSHYQIQRKQNRGTCKVVYRQRPDCKSRLKNFWMLTPSQFIFFATS